ncbi:MAG TPA: isocitrate lyase/PEP mutase family protein [Nocardioides sp.]|nr:isocitrate lyase/PEP mutase family protein [Nocardioides sp.]
MTPGDRLREMLAAESLIVAPGVFDGVSAHLVRRMGFAAAYLTGAGVAASGFGLPDIGLVTGTEMAERAAMVTAALGDVPLIADADTGYGAPLNVVRTVKTYERAGVAAIQLEDQKFPKRCGHLPDKELVSPETFLAALGAALEARTDALIVARTDARGPLGIDEAIKRANIYAGAGADVLFVEAPHSAEEIERIAKEVRAPLLINNVAGGRTPELSDDHLRALGYRISIHPGNPLVAAAFSMVDALGKLGGNLPEPTRPNPTPTGPAALFDLVGLREWSAVGERWKV